MEYEKICGCKSGKIYRECCYIYDKSSNKNKGKKIMLVIGNGFTLNYLNSINSTLNSSIPFLGFNSGRIKSRVEFFYSKLRGLNEKIYNYRDEDDFKTINNLLKIFEVGKEERLLCYLKRFITLVYSEFQIEIDKNLKFNDWEIFKWIKANKNNITDVLNFNYDLVLERVLNEINLKYCRPFTIEETFYSKCRIYKPHGSIDFDLPSQAINVGLESRWQIITKDNQYYLGNKPYLNVLQSTDLLIPRVQQDIVLPTCKNIQKNLSWVKALSEQLKERVKKIDKIIIIGFGYREEDKLEFNEVISGLDNNKKIDFYNLGFGEDNIELKKAIEASKHKYKFIDLKSMQWKEIIDII